jgi:hypothetical protein
VGALPRLDRPDTHPSAAVDAESGTYVDLGSGCRMSFFDLAVALGIYHDYRDAIADLGGNLCKKHHSRMLRKPSQHPR